MRRRIVFTALCLFLFAGFARTSNAQSQPAGNGAEPSGAEFYETKVRPILEAHCYACHGGLDGKKVKS